MEVCSSTPLSTSRTPPPKQHTAPISRTHGNRTKQPPPISKVPWSQKRVDPLSEEFTNTVAVCSLMKDEEVDDVMEWLEYHRCVSQPPGTCCATQAQLVHSLCRNALLHCLTPQ